MYSSGQGRGTEWDGLAPGETLTLRAASSLHRDVYGVQVLGCREDRLQVTFPMKEGRIVLLPVGTTVVVRRCSGAGGEVWTKLVQRIPGPRRSLLLARPCPETPLVEAKPRGARAPIIALAGGKGGVGTTVLGANLAAALADSGRTVCLVDAAPGLGDADVLLNVHPRWSLTHVLRGDRSPFEAATRGPGRMLLVAGGHPGAAEGVGRRGLDQLLGRLEQLGRYVDGIVVDAGSGATRYQAGLLARADVPIIVCTPDPHAVTDAYALLHGVAKWEGSVDAQLVINQGEEAWEAEDMARKMEFAASRFLGIRLTMLGVVPRDRGVERAVRQQRLFLRENPRGRASAAVRALARKLMQQAGMGEGGRDRGLGRGWRLSWRRSAQPIGF